MYFKIIIKVQKSTYNIRVDVGKRFCPRTQIPYNNSNGGNMNILIVEDDKKIGEELVFQLDILGYEPYLVDDFTRVLDIFREKDYKLVLMDLKLPYKNGFYWVREIRKISKVPIIFLTSASDDINLINAINYGADDFIAKPFAMGLLDIKIKALIRRAYDFVNDDNILWYGEIKLTRDKMVLTYDDKDLSLSKNEYLIMEILMRNPGEVVSREKIMDKLWATDSFIDDNTLSVNVNRLRKKLASLGLDDFIQTKKTVGYFIQ